MSCLLPPRALSSCRSSTGPSATGAGSGTVALPMAASATARSATVALPMAASATARSATGERADRRGMVRDDERGCRPAGTAGHPTHALLQHQLLVLLPPRPAEHQE